MYNTRMKKMHLLLISFMFIFVGCSYSPPAPVEVTLGDKKIDYLKDVKPILDNRCVSCHSCYNSPCQAKFSSFAGMDRGGSKDKVYLAERLFAQDPTRLFIDATTTGEWRDKDFFTLSKNLDESNENSEINSSVYVDSVMGHMLYDKKNNPEVIGEYAPEYDKLICPETLSEVSEYQDKHPNHGMPYGFPSLSEEEYGVIMQWLAQGGNGPTVTQQWELEKPLEKDQLAINKWEIFLNQSDAKHVMTARYLYEHYFLAHINFSSEPDAFYSLIRSSTPAPLKPQTLKTLRPYDKPEVDTFYYRFLKIHSTIVHKTHMVVKFDKQEFQRVNELFINTKWLEKPHVMGYDEEYNSNAFIVYAQIPPVSRYKFMLDHNEYLVRTFIRGPICKGNIALSVIRDHFWLIFQDPEYDIGVNLPEFLTEQSDNLRLPVEEGSGMLSFWFLSDKYRARYKSYYDAKMEKIVQFYPDGMPIESIWKGRRASDSPALTAYRHFDSGSILKGVYGKLPKTIWLIDYAQFERIYYTLVAGFDVYGTVSHQMEVRRYMDFLRLEGELNYLSYLPKASRPTLLESFYQGKGVAKDIEDEAGYTAKIRAQYEYKTKNVKQEFIEHLVDNHFLKESNIHFDKINYFRMDEKAPELPRVYKSKKDLFQGLRSLTAEGSGFIKYMVGTGVNLAYIRVRMKDGTDLRGSFIVNRWHDNVNSAFREKKSLNPSKDSLDILEGSIGSYPNVFFDVKEEELPDFFDMVKNFQENERYYAKARKYAISRSNENFWDYFDWFQEEFEKDEPLEAGLYDLNRYYKMAW